MNLRDRMIKQKQDNKKLVVVTAYDYWSARILNDTDVNAILIGDCSSMVMHGNTNTLNCNVEQISTHVSAVKKGAPDKMLVAAMPFMSNRKGLKNAMDNVEKLVRSGANAIKIEGVDGNEELIHQLSESGIPVIGHIGLTPTHHNMNGGFTVQGKTLEAESKLIADAKKLEALGCVCIVVEAVPEEVGETIMHAVKIPAIGVGAGLNMDGQALVLQDLLGMSVDFKPKFVRTYMDGAKLIKNAVNEFTNDVHTGAFPSAKETYTSNPLSQIRPRFNQKQAVKTMKKSSA